MESRGKAPLVGLGDEITQKLKQFADSVYRFWLQKRSKIEIFAQISLPPDSWRVCFTVEEGLTDIWGLAP